MAEVFDFGLQQHKIKMDGKFFENNLFAVAGDTGRRLEVQLLDSNNMVQNTTGISLRLNAYVAGQATYAEATLVDAAQGLYRIDLPNGMLIAPGNWQFQWQIIGANGEKLHSFAFMGTIGSNLAEGAAEGLNFYLNLTELKQMQEDFISGAFNSAALETNISEKLTALETGYAPKLTDITTQLTRKITQGTGSVTSADLSQEVKEDMTGGSVAVVGKNAVLTENIVDRQVTAEKTNFIDVQVIDNLMTKKDYVNGYVLNNTGSAEPNVARFTVKSPITVTAGEPYIFSKNGVGVIVDKIVFKTTNIYNDHEGYISNTVNVLSGEYVTPPTNTTYMFVTFYTRPTGWTNAEVELFLSDLVVEKSTTITPVEPDKLMNVTVPYLDNEIELLKSSGGSVYDATNKINDYTSLTGQVANTVGWTEPNESYNTLAKGIPVTPGKEYSATIEGFPLTMQVVVFKTADDISFYEASTFLNRTINKMSVIAPENAKFMFLSMGNTTDLNKVVIQESPYPISQVEPTLKGFTYPNTSLYGANMMTLGDSLSEEGIWQSYVMSKLGIASLTNLAIGGKKSSEFADNVTADNMANIDIVTVMGFFNSATSPAGTVNDVPSNVDTDSICANYKYIIQKLYGFNKKVKIVLITPHRPLANDVADKAEAVKSVALYYGIPCIDLYNTAGFNERTYSEYLRDAVHSSYGYKGGYNREAEVITGGLIHYYG